MTPAANTAASSGKNRFLNIKMHYFSAGDLKSNVTHKLLFFKYRKNKLNWYLVVLLSYSGPDLDISAKII